MFLHRMHTRGHVAALTEPIGLTTSDTGNAWVVAPRPEDAPPSVRPVTVVGPDVRDRVEAPADLLYRVLWQRAPADDPRVETCGDTTRVFAFLASRLVP